VNELVPEVGWLVAFGAGLISFFSPCVAPLVPGYVSFVSGVSLQELTEPRSEHTRHVLGSTLLFVAGFTLVFVLLGTSAALFGGLFEAYRRPLGRLAGGVMVLMGLVVIGLVHPPALLREWRFHPVPGGLSHTGAVLLGMAFGFGWTPCVGPILASILFYAGAAETAERGALLLLVYSLGLGVPFILTGLGFCRMLRVFDWVKRRYRAINLTSGAVLVAVGLLFVTERFFWISIATQRLYYTLFG
jgi:cytochrome c-type biogenesis protein